MVLVRRLYFAHRMPSEGGPALRKQTILFFGGAFLAGALGSLLFSPAPVGAVAREIIELQRDVTALLQGQKRSEEHTSELQSPCNLVCRLLLEKKNKRRHSEPPRSHVN